MPRPQSNPFPPVVASIKARLLDQVFGGAGSVAVSTRDLTPNEYLGEPRALSFRVGGFLPTPNPGAGRWAAPFARRVYVSCYTRVELDSAESRETALVDASLGHLWLEELVVAALHLWTPQDTSTPPKNLVTEPIRLLPEQPDAEDTEGDPASEQIKSLLVYEAKLLFPFGP